MVMLCKVTEKKFPNTFLISLPTSYTCTRYVNYVYPLNIYLCVHTKIPFKQWTKFNNIVI